jgi:Kef-type K+ transport system membrane component KefB
VDTTAHLLLTLAAVIVLGRIVGRLLALIGQPPVIGEVIAGIMLGPSLLGQLVDGGPAWLLPPEVAPILREIAQLGVILYMFLVGLELHAGRIRKLAGAAIAISHASILVPFALGTALGMLLYERLSAADVPMTSFALFMGAAMAITAFPVLARILSDRGMARSELGVMALTCAAAGDLSAWCLLAFVVGAARADVEGAIVVVVWALGYVAAMFLMVRPIFRRLAAHWNGDSMSPGAIAVVLVALLLSALATELIGIHALFGAFLLGAVIPHDSGIARAMTRNLENLVTILLLPAFFAFSGMRTEIALVSGVGDWLVCGLLILVATAGKFGGACVAARLTGLGWRPAAALGVLMNTRGLMELIALNIGLDMQVISPTVYAMMVLMALVTTMATAPLLELIVRRTNVAVPAPTPSLVPAKQRDPV